MQHGHIVTTNLITKKSFQVYTDQSAQTSPTPQEGISEETRFGTFDFFLEKSRTKRDPLSIFIDLPPAFFLVVHFEPGSSFFWLYEVLSDSARLTWTKPGFPFWLHGVVAKGSTPQNLCGGIEIPVREVQKVTLID